MCYKIEICSRCGQRQTSKGDFPQGDELDWTICSDCIFSVSWEELDEWQAEAIPSRGVA